VTTLTRGSVHTTQKRVQKQEGIPAHSESATPPVHACMQAGYGLMASLLVLRTLLLVQQHPATPRRAAPRKPRKYR
jgi:hypothetical protein